MLPIPEQDNMLFQRCAILPMRERYCGLAKPLFHKSPSTGSLGGALSQHMQIHAAHFHKNGQPWIKEGGKNNQGSVAKSPQLVEFGGTALEVRNSSYVLALSVNTSRVSLGS